jgi:hypothetical protein
MPLQIGSYLLKCSQMAVLCFGAPDCPGRPYVRFRPGGAREGRKLRPGLCPGPAKGIALGTNQAVITHRLELPSPDEPVATLKE